MDPRLAPAQAPQQWQQQQQQGPLDWLVPFIPPFLRVNRDTRASFAAFVRSLSLSALAAQLSTFIRANGATVARVALVAALWIAGLVWTERHAREFSGAYVTLSGLGALMLHALSGERSAPVDGLSAYSVFNAGGARMLGSLSAEQFEVRSVCALAVVATTTCKTDAVVRASRTRSAIVSQDTWTTSARRRQVVVMQRKTRMRATTRTRTTRT